MCSQRYRTEIFLGLAFAGFRIIEPFQPLVCYSHTVRVLPFSVVHHRHVLCAFCKRSRNEANQKRRRNRQSSEQKEAELERDRQYRANLHFGVLPEWTGKSVPDTGRLSNTGPLLSV